MDKKGIIQEHSKIKLELYRLYLERYLSVLSMTNHFVNIDVLDIFAGCGFSNNNEKGSAVIAAETISNIQSAHASRVKNYKLRLNDFDKKNYNSLKLLLKNYDFTDITCIDANEYIEKWQPSKHTHHLFFIDPHGYTQVSTKNLQRLFTAPYCDFLIFVPIYHIYRFLKPSDTATTHESEDLLPGFDIKKHTRKIDPDKFYESIAEFLSGLGIDRKVAIAADDVEKFADMISSAIKNISNSSYVYIQMIKNKEHNSKYCLFFISHSILGAEKFLEAKVKLKETIQEPKNQTAFDFVSENTQKNILNFVKYDYNYDNVSLYELGIKSGFLATDLKKQLKNMEKNGINKVQIKALPGHRRNCGGLYINYKNYKKQRRIVSITFTGGLWDNLQ